MLASLATFAAEPATAPESVPPAQAVAVAQQADPVVCNYFYHEGSVIKKPTCMTKHQWERRQLEEQRYIREFQLRTLDQHM
jgi:hypothetical protein